MRFNSTPLEDQEQQAFVNWLRVVGLRHHHSPNATGSSPEAQRRAIRMKRLGTSAGFPDLVVVLPPERANDGIGRLLCIELKRVRGGHVSPAQKDWCIALNALNTPHIEAVVAHGSAEAIEYVSSYMRKPHPSEVF